MEKRRLGKTDMYVNPVGLGCMGISHAFGTALSKNEGIELLRRAYEIGYNFYDTAECYTGVNEDGSISNNEEIVGEGVKPFRDKIILATKFGVNHGGDHLEMDSSPETIRKSLEGSLRRLQTDYIDLYYQHRIDPKVEPETVAEVMKQLIEEGKIKSWGISETDEEYLRRANKICPVTAIQNRYSMIARDHEILFPVCKELGVTYVAFSPMANGFLSGAYNVNSKFDEKTDFRSFMPQYTEEGFKSAEGLMNLLDKLSKEKNCTKAELSLAWMICKENFIVPIPGSRKIEHLESNFNSSKVELTKEEIKEIDEYLEKINVPVFGWHK